MCNQSLSHVWLFMTPWTVAPARLLCPWDFPGKNTGVGCHYFQNYYTQIWLWRWLCDTNVVEFNFPSPPREKIRKSGYLGTWFLVKGRKNSLWWEFLTKNQSTCEFEVIIYTTWLFPKKCSQKLKEFPSCECPHGMTEENTNPRWKNAS